MTVAELKEICEREIANGYGDCNVILCVNDSEYYPLDNGFSSVVYNSADIHDLIESMGLQEDDAIVLN